MTTTEKIAVELLDSLDVTVDPSDMCCPLDIIRMFAPDTYGSIADDHDADLKQRDILSHGAGCHFCD
jgi:hypothetical protein